MINFLRRVGFVFWDYVKCRPPVFMLVIVLLANESFGRVASSVSLPCAMLRPASVSPSVRSSVSTIAFCGRRVRGRYGRACPAAGSGDAPLKINCWNCY